MAVKKEEVKITRDKLKKWMNGYTQCSKCGEIYKQETKYFYASYSSLYCFSKRLNVCKNCLSEEFKNYLKQYKEIKRAIFEICRTMDYAYLDNLYDSAELEFHKRFKENEWNKLSFGEKGIGIWGVYMKNICSLPQYREYTFKHGEIDIFEREMIETRENKKELIEDNKRLDNKLEIISKQELTDEILQQKVTDKKNKEDVIRIIGYDPVENELEEDKPKLYAKLTNMLSMLGEEDQKDEMKISGMIDIARNQNQVSKINDVITMLSSDTKSLIDNVGTIKSLTDTKEKLNKTISLTAKDNQLSDFYSGSKSPGTGTLTGMVKKLKELDLSESQVNLFDIQTSLGMLQVARLSSKAIVENLNFGDDDLLDMVNFQRGKLEFYEKEYSKLREENRRIKAICTYNNIDYSEVVIDTDYKDELEYGEAEQQLMKDELESFNKMVKDVLPLTTEEYADKVIKDREEEEKQKMINNIK